MTGSKDSVRRPGEAQDKRTARLAAALRANLKRRKEQVRARARAGKAVDPKREGTGD